MLKKRYLGAGGISTDFADTFFVKCFYAFSCIIAVS